MSKFEFRDKYVWITGASSGIGEAMACELASLGVHTILSARREDKLKSVCKRCSQACKSLVVPLDITSQQSIASAVERIAELPRLDLVIHNAGVAQKGTVEENLMETERRIMETNYFGTVALTKAVLPIFKNQGYGWFAVVTSVAGIIGVPGRSIYSASKHALHGFFESFRAEVHPENIFVSIVMPGFINTGITLKELKGDGTEYGKYEKSHQMGMSPITCAHRIIQGLSKRKQNIVVGGFEVTGVYMQRFLPGLYSMLIRNHPMKHWRSFKRTLHLSPKA